MRWDSSRPLWSGSLRCASWANSDAVVHSKRALVEVELAKEHNGSISIIQDVDELSEDAAVKRQRLMDIPLDRRLYKGKLILQRSDPPCNA